MAMGLNVVLPHVFADDPRKVPKMELASGPNHIAFLSRRIDLLE
jgi:hypothetical protein